MQIDSALLQSAQLGDRDAIAQLLIQLKPDIRRYARRQCHRSSVLEDVVQEALIVVYPYGSSSNCIISQASSSDW